MTSLPVGSGIGRGRGRGRGLWIRPLDDVDEGSKAQKPYLPAVEDATDGCIFKPRPFIDFGDRFSDDVNDEKGSVKGPVSTPRSLDKSTSSNPSDNLKPQKVSIFNQEEASTAVPIKVIRVNLDQKYAEIQHSGEKMKCKVGLHKSPLLLKWMDENKLIFKIETLVESSLLSAFEMTTEESLTAYAGKTESDGFFPVAIDVFEFDELRTNFLTSLIFMMVPRLPAMKRHKLGVITNLRVSDEIDVVFYDQVWLGMREAIHDLQMANNLFGPRCQVLQELFGEMIEGYNVQYFLAPLSENWNELHRVKVLGVEFDHLVKVLYVDLGKQCSIHIKNLAMPLRANYIPELLEKVPPQAVKLRVAELDSGLGNTLKGLRSVVEGRVCYVQTVNDTNDADLPVVNIFLENSYGMGTVSLADLVASTAGNTVASDNMDFKKDMLKIQEKRLDGLILLEKEFRLIMAYPSVIVVRKKIWERVGNILFRVCTDPSVQRIRVLVNVLSTGELGNSNSAMVIVNHAHGIYEYKVKK